MVDNRAARTSGQDPDINGERKSWVGKVVIFAVLAGIVALLVTAAD